MNTFNIFNSIVAALYTPILWVVGLFPASNPTVNSSILTFTTDFKTWIAPADYIMPVGSIFSILGIVIAIESSLFVISTASWFVNLITLGKIPFLIRK